MQTAKLIAKANIKFDKNGFFGLVDDLTSDICFACTQAFLKNVASPTKKVIIGHDLSSSSLHMTKVCIQAAKRLNFECEYAGALPSSALAHCSMKNKLLGIMITGTNLPPDYNGVNFYHTNCHISRSDEATILSEDVNFPDELLLHELPEVNIQATKLYINRYTDFFEHDYLSGKSIGIYGRRGVMRDVLKAIFTQLGASVILLEYSDDLGLSNASAIRQKNSGRAREWAIENCFQNILFQKNYGI